MSGKLCLIAEECGTDKGAIGHNYTPKYEELLGHLADSNITMLEIGVDKGFSMHMWHRFFTRASIIGMDINFDRLNGLRLDEDLKRRCPRVTLVQGDQSNWRDVLHVCKDFGPFDFVVDDGSHITEDQLRSFCYIFPLFIKPGGYYFIEDLSGTITADILRDFEASELKKYFGIASMERAGNLDNMLVVKRTW